MRWPSWLLRIVTEHRSFLMAVERFHCRVDIKYPWFAQQRPGAIVELLLKPGPPSFPLDLAQCPSNRILAHHLRHPEQRRIDRVAAQRRDMCVAPMPGQYRQHPANTDNITVPSMSRFDGGCRPECGWN